MPGNKLKLLLTPLFRKLRIDATQLAESRSYQMEFQGLLLVWEENPDDHLTLSCQIPLSDSASQDPYTLNVLLQCNLLGLEHPPILTAILPELNSVLLWTRDYFNSLQPHQLIILFESFIEQACKVHSFLTQHE